MPENTLHSTIHNVLGMPRPVRTFQDPVTGVTIHQVTEGPEPSAHLYFTSPSWAAGGKHLIFCRRRDWHKNLCVAAPNGEVRQLTFYAPDLPEPQAIEPHMNRRFLAWELAPGLLVPGSGCEAVHPSLPLIAYGLRYDVHLLNLETGEDTIIHTFPESEGNPPEYSMGPTGFTADGKDLILFSVRPMREGEARIDPPDQPYDFSLRDESHIVSRLWRYDLEKHCIASIIFESNGENTHSLTCPWDPDLILWVNYLHKCFYTINRDGTGLRRFLHDTPYHPGHYNWDVANRRLTTLVSLPKEKWLTHLASMDVNTGELKHYPSAEQNRGQYHQNASPDGRWVVLDAPRIPVGNSNGLHLLDQQTGQLHPLCELNCSWGMTGPDGEFVKSEWLHPNPSWSPDGRYVIVRSDFGQGVDNVQIYLVDVSTWQANK